MSKNPNDIAAPRFRTMAHVELFGEEHWMRDRTAVRPVPADFFFNGSGLGDYICFMSAILWLAKNAPWVRGTLRVPTFFKPLAEHWLKKKPHWNVLDGEQTRYTFRGDSPIVGPDLTGEDGTNLTPQLLNPLGSHLVDLGFAYYCNMCPAPLDATYPRLNPSAPLPPELAKLKGQYVVFTPGGVTTSRMVKARHLNPLIDYVRKLGLTPVFLGRGNYSGGLNAQFDPEINYGAGINLINKTDLFEAAAIMERGVCVLGLDNGLLHLAATTEASVIFGYNIASPKFREPRRTWGRLENVTVTREKLPCIHCQDHIKMLFTHSFHSCLYGDQKCIDLLFENDAEKFKKAIDGMLPPGL